MGREEDYLQELELREQTDEFSERAEACVTHNSQVLRVLLRHWCYAWWCSWNLSRQALKLVASSNNPDDTPRRKEIFRQTNEAKRKFWLTLIFNFLELIVVVVLILQLSKIIPDPPPTATYTPTSTPTLTPTATPTPTPIVTETVTFTITCATVEHMIQSRQPITLSAVNAVFIEPNFIPKDWEVLTGTLLKLPGEEKKFSYSSSGSGSDMVTFTFSINEQTGSVITKVLPITIVSERQGLCYSENDLE